VYARYACIKADFPTCKESAWVAAPLNSSCGWHLVTKLPVILETSFVTI